MKLEPSKTRLVAFCRKREEVEVSIAQATSNVTIRGEKVEFCSELEHVGVIRNKSGNLPHIVTRIAKHKKALGAVLFTGVQSLTEKIQQPY